jgi:hypothetical protein
MNRVPTVLLFLRDEQQARIVEQMITVDVGRVSVEDAFVIDSLKFGN